MLQFWYLLLAVATAAAASDIPQLLSLKQALALSFRLAPELQATKEEVRACEVRRQRAGLLPNPNFWMALEDFGGSGEHQGYRLAETTILLSQLIELGGKRAKRSLLADSACRGVRWDYEAHRLQMALNTNRTFIDVLAGQERVALAEQLSTAVEARISSGGSSQLERYRASVELTKASIELERAEQELQVARQNLAASLVDLEPCFERVEGRLYLPAAHLRPTPRPAPPESRLGPLGERDRPLATALSRGA